MSLNLETINVSFAGHEPYRATDGAVAYDLVADETVYILPGEVRKIKTGTRLALPTGCEGLINVRSSIGASGIMLANGTGIIDSDYRGELIVALYNANTASLLVKLASGETDLAGDDLYKMPGTVKISAGDRIAQLRIRTVPRVSLTEVEELPETKRGEGGFGSTGK